MIFGCPEESQQNHGEGLIPMIIEIIQNLDSPIEFVYESPKNTHSRQQLDWSHNATRQDRFQPDQSWISDRNTWVSVNDWE